MAERVITMSKWSKEADRLARTRPERMNGPSPGGAASELRVSRQAIHQAIKDDRLDAWRIVSDTDHERLVAIIVTGESLSRLKVERGVRETA
jgi:hypothetical protein